MPDTSTEVALATTTLSSAASTITFSSIPNTYTDLRLVLVAASNSSANLVNPYVRFNSDTATNYSNTRLIGNGSSASSERSSNQSEITLTWWGNIVFNNWAMYTMDIFSYTGSTNKTSLITAQEDWNGSGSVSNRVALWRSTSAINSIVITSDITNGYKAGTTATLYGIL